MWRALDCQPAGPQELNAFLTVGNRALPASIRGVNRALPRIDRRDQ